MTTQAEQSPADGIEWVVAPAKINLFLNILGKREDGFHELETVMAPLAFGDEIAFCDQAEGITLECDHPSLPTDDGNLAVRAAQQLADRFSVSRGVRMVLRKRIPIAAGLAGGSSNAATVLTGLNRFWDLAAPDEALHEIAAGLGSDINFFLAGGTAVCRGRGEQVEPVPHRPAGHVLLVNPGFGISTAWAYRAWSERWATQSPLTGPVPPVSVLRQALADGDLPAIGSSLYNSLEAPALLKFPVLQLLKERLLEQGAAGAMMSGSGATVFGLFADEANATRAGDGIRSEFGPSTWTQVTQMLADWKNG